MMDTTISAHLQAARRSEEITRPVDALLVRPLDRRHSEVILANPKYWVTPEIRTPYSALARGVLEAAGAWVVGRQGFATVGDWTWPCSPDDGWLRGCVTVEPTPAYVNYVEKRCVQVPRLLSELEKDWTLLPDERGGWQVKGAPCDDELRLLWSPRPRGDFWAVEWREDEGLECAVSISRNPAAALEEAPDAVESLTAEWWDEDCPA